MSKSDTEKTFILTDECFYFKNPLTGKSEPNSHRIQVVDEETGQVREILTGARIRFLSGKISPCRT